MSVCIVDYGMGNLASVRRAFEECGANVFVSDEPKDLREATRIVLPGVGSFADAMGQLNKGGWVSELRKAVLEDGVPMLGICLGMQLLADVGTEGGVTEGLGFIPGSVRRFVPTEERVPHVGWNEVNPTDVSHPIMEGIRPGTDFYFVHSYRFEDVPETCILASTPYCGDFPSVVGRDNIVGVQFHPEKSLKPGFRLIQKFIQFS